MARIPNTYAAQTPIGQAINNMGLALFSGPSPLEQQQLAADMEYRRALTDQALAETRLKQREESGYADFGTLMSTFADPASRGPDQLSAALPQLLNAATNISPAQASAIARMVVANMGGSDDQTVRALAGAGNPIGVNEAVSLAGQQNVADRNQGYAVDLNDADNAAARERQAMSDTAAMERYLMTPVNVSAGGKVLFNKADPRAATAGSVVSGQPTLSTQQGAAFANLPPEQQARAVGPSKSNVEAQILQGLSPEDQRSAVVGSSGGGTPITIDGNDLTDAWSGIASWFDGGVDENGYPTTDFWAAVGTKRQAAEEAIAAEFQRTRNIAQAQIAGLKALGVDLEHTTLEGTGYFDGDPRFETPQAPEVTAPETPTAPVAPEIGEGETVIQNGWIYRRQGGQMVPVGPVS